MENIMNKVIEYIEEHISLEITLENICDEFSYSKSHLSRMFNKHVGISISCYVTKRRLARASFDIKNTLKPIEYISDIYGFQSSKYFSTLFKKEYNMTPSNYRKQKGYVYIYPKRIIKGGNIMNIPNITELIDFLLSNSSTQDELLDSIALLENVERYQQEDAEVELFCIIEKEQHQVVVQLELNLISGKHRIRPIFTTHNSPNTKVESIYKTDNDYIVVFEQNNKKIEASLFFVGEAHFEVSCETTLFDASDYNPDESFLETHLNVQKYAEKLLSVQNNLELEEVISNNPDLLKLKAFVNEYALIYRVHTKKTLALFSIYLNLKEQTYRQINVFSTPNRFKNFNFYKDKQYAVVSSNDQEIVRASIYSRDLQPTYALKFPNGSTGTGAWNLDNMF